MRHLRRRYAEIVATLALFIALGGGAYAVSLSPQSVGTKHLKNKAVTAKKIKGGAVATGKLRDAGVISKKLADGAVGTEKLAEGAVGTAALEDQAVTMAKLAGGAVGAAQVADESLGLPQLEPALRARITDPPQVTIRFANFSIPSNDTATGTAMCEPGEVATGGGVGLTSGFTTMFRIWSSRPVNANGDSTAGDTPVGWIGSGRNEAPNGNFSARVWVACAG